MGVVGMTARARTPTGPEPAPARVATPRPATAAIVVGPALTRITPQAVLHADHPTVIRLTGDHFAPGVTVTLQSDWYVYTFGRDSISAQSSRGFDLAIIDVQPGTYAVTTCNPDGLRSAPQTLVLKTS